MERQDKGEDVKQLMHETAVALGGLRGGGRGVAGGGGGWAGCGCSCEGRALPQAPAPCSGGWSWLELQPAGWLAGAMELAAM